MDSVFKNRSEAGRILGERLAAQSDDRGPEPVVLALPRGGVPVAYEVARVLGAPLDVLSVRKLGVPAQPELAMGAIASGGALFVDHEIMRSAHVTQAQFDAVLQSEQAELARREALYRGQHEPLGVQGKTAIVVDDGIATGATMHAAVKALRERQPARIVVAVPVSPPGAEGDFAGVADVFVALVRPTLFFSVGQYYEDFGQTTDDEVRALLARAYRSDAGSRC